MISSVRLGIAITDDVIRLSLVSRQLNSIQIRDLLTLSAWQEKSLPDLKSEVTKFLKRNKTSELAAVLSLPRREVVVRQLTLPGDAQSNLAKVLEYQIANLLPAEDALVVYDYSVAKYERNAASLSVTVFLAMRSLLEKHLQICEGLGIKVVRVVPAGVALTNTLALLSEHIRSKNVLFLQFSNRGYEVTGASDQRLVAWREAELGADESLADSLITEVAFFRSQARLVEDAPLDVFISGAPDSAGDLDAGALKVKCHTLFRPQDLGLNVGGSVVNSRQLQDHLNSLSAGISGLRSKVPEPTNLLPPERRVQKRGWQHVTTYGLLAVNCLLTLAVAIRGRVQDGRYSSRLDQEINRLEPEVRKVRNVEDQLAQLIRRVDFLAGFKELNPEVLQALAELSKVLPKHTVVSDLSFKEGIIQISGLSGEAASLPQVIENSPLFREVEFVSAITRSSLAPDKEGYRITMKLESALKRQSASLGLPTGGPQPAPGASAVGKPQQAVAGGKKQ